MKILKPHGSTRACSRGDQLREAKKTNIPFMAALTGALRRCSSLVWLATRCSERLALHTASAPKNGILAISASLKLFSIDQKRFGADQNEWFRQRRLLGCCIHGASQRSGNGGRIRIQDNQASQSPPSGSKFCSDPHCRGLPSAMVVSMEEGQRLFPSAKPSLVAHLMAMPEPIPVKRNRSAVRSIDL